MAVLAATKRFIKITNSVAFLGMATLFCLFYIGQAHAIKLTTKRVIFEGSKRAENIVIINKSNSEEIYRIGWRPMVMKETGNLVLDEQAAATVNESPYAIENMVRYAPRRIVVPANTSQQLRLLLRTPPNLPDGEYRSHLFINTEKLADEKSSSGKGNSVTLTAKPGVTIPVFVRKGSLSYEISFARLSAIDSGSHIDVAYALNRDGNKSVYGRMEIICNHKSSNSYILRSIKNLAIYTDINQRHQTIRVPKLPNKGECNELKVKFYEDTGPNKKIKFLVEETATVGRI